MISINFYLKNLEMLDSPEINWGNSRTFRVLSAVGFMPTDGDFWSSQNGLLASDLAKACQYACDRIRTDGLDWLSEFIDSDAATAKVISELGRDGIDCGHFNPSAFGRNIAVLRDACEGAIAIGGADTVVQFN